MRRIAACRQASCLAREGPCNWIDSEREGRGAAGEEEQQTVAWQGIGTCVIEEERGGERGREEERVVVLVRRGTLYGG